MRYLYQSPFLMRMNFWLNFFSSCEFGLQFYENGDRMSFKGILRTMYLKVRVEWIFRRNSVIVKRPRVSSIVERGFFGRDETWSIENLGWD